MENNIDLLVSGTVAANPSNLSPLRATTCLLRGMPLWWEKTYW